MLKQIKNEKAHMIKVALYGCIRYLMTAEDIKNEKHGEKDAFICFALSNWAREKPNSKYRQKAKNLAHKYISDTLKNTSVTAWLIVNKHITGFTYELRPVLQEYRHRWVRHMIKQMSQWEKED